MPNLSSMGIALRIFVPIFNIWSNVLLKSLNSLCGSATETTYYSNLDKVRNVKPQGFVTLQENEQVAMLKGTDPNRQVGPSITIKVNAGDKIGLSAQSFYPEGADKGRNGLSETALGQLVNALINPAGLNATGKTLATDALKSQVFGNNTDYQNVMGQLPSSEYGKDNNRPKAYMVWMLFDKEMKLVKTGNSSGAIQIPEGAGQVKQMAQNDIVMDQGGFLTAYTVSESPTSVSIDNFQLTQIAGSVLEQNDYYPFGMLNNGLSVAGTASPLNYYKYNGKELQNELSLAWLDHGARFYDPQIGRWTTPDKLAEYMRRWSPYNYVFNNPIKFTDPTGMMGQDTIRLPMVVITPPQKDKSVSSRIESFLWAAVDYIPFAGSAKQFGTGIYHGDWKEAGIGALMLGVDIFTGGEGGEAIKVAETLTEDLIKVAAEDEIKEGAEKALEEEGLVYERIHPKTSERYVGQAKSDKRYMERQGEHDRELGVKHKFNPLGRAKPGEELNKLEETHIRLGGGPQNKGGTLANKRYQMSESKYKAAGGSVGKPTQ
jgi:RHS repeat-associated protein